ncbi:unnamed protein product [Mycena citricolor]|uniref:Uncharacterized protein n=1 Tax=Mycena citricolor TaxID=2018698 RepID=A0AAD2GVW3_9AGAR|nr:unnamed protein product [Mycena citricolor]
MRQALTRGPSSSDSSVDDGGSHTEALDAAATHYAGPQKGKYRITREFRKRFTLRGVVDRLLRKTVRKNTWIYVSDKHFNIFIGIKKTGTFQHSSLLGGGVVTSAGLITVKQGIVYKLSPLSGHYRTSISHFEHFVDVLRERGVDMHKARISRAVIALWGIERIKKAQKKKARVIEAGKENLSTAVEKITEPSSWKRDVLEGRRRS